MLWFSKQWRNGGITGWGWDHVFTRWCQWTWMMSFHGRTKCLSTPTSKAPCSLLFLWFYLCFRSVRSASASVNYIATWSDASVAIRKGFVQKAHWHHINQTPPEESVADFDRFCWPWWFVSYMINWLYTCVYIYTLFTHYTYYIIIYYSIILRYFCFMI